MITNAARFAFLSVASLGALARAPHESRSFEPASQVHASAQPARAARSLDRTAELARSALLASEYLGACVLADGRFSYRLNPNPGVTVSASYNILRHAGTLWAMCDAHSAGAELGEAILRAAHFLRSQVAPIEGVPDTLAVWSDPEVNHRDDDPVQAKLGGTGLGLVALLAVRNLEPDAAPLEELRGMGRFLMYMQEPDGRFVSKYVPAEGGKDDSWRSLYYPGEASLGLVMLHEADPEGPWLGSALHALLHLADSRRGSDDVPADHWALIATARILPHVREAPPATFGDAEERLVDHARQIVDEILASQVELPDGDPRDGGFTRDGRTTPAATRLEGLQASLSILPEGDPRRETVEAAVDRGVRFLLDSQIDSGLLRGAWSRAIATRSDESDSFNERATEVRIDYVQHALSVMLNALRTAAGPDRAVRLDGE